MKHLTLSLFWSFVPVFSMQIEILEIKKICKKRHEVMVMIIESALACKADAKYKTVHTSNNIANNIQILGFGKRSAHC